MGPKALPKGCEGMGGPLVGSRGVRRPSRRAGRCKQVLQEGWEW